MLVHREIPEFIKAFKKHDKYCAVDTWSYSPQYKLDNDEGWLVVVVFTNNRKVRYFSKQFPDLDTILNLINKNKLKHNDSGQKIK